MVYTPSTYDSIVRRYARSDESDERAAPHRVFPAHLLERQNRSGFGETADSVLYQEQRDRPREEEEDPNQDETKSSIFARVVRHNSRIPPNVSCAYSSAEARQDPTNRRFECFGGLL